jgi:hypothetical protein
MQGQDEGRPSLSDLERCLRELEGMLADAKLDGNLLGNEFDSSAGHRSEKTPE